MWLKNVWWSYAVSWKPLLWSLQEGLASYDVHKKLGQNILVSCMCCDFNVATINYSTENFTCVGKIHNNKQTFVN